MTNHTDLIARLSNGWVTRPKRWSGDTHHDFPYGSLDDEATDLLMKEAADALETAQAENAQWRVDFKEMVIERNAALARLAITEEANSMLLARNKWLEHTLEVAGASPVEPSQAQPPAPSDAAREYMTGYSDGREWAGATSQAQQAQSVPEPVLQWCDKCGEGTVQGLCRGKLDDCKFKQAQPEAGVQSILDEMAEDEQLLMDRDMGDS